MSLENVAEINIETEENVETDLKKLKELVKERNYKKALEFSEKCSKDDEVIQSHRIKLLIRFNRLKDALKLSDECWNRFHNLVFLSQKISILVKMNRLKEAYSLCELEEAKKHFSIQSQKIMILRKQKKFEEALNLCDYSEFKDIGTIQTQKILLLMDLNRLEEAFLLCNSCYKNDPETFLISKITVLKRMNRLEEALEICNQECHDDNMYVQAEKIKILIQMGKIAAAFKICDKYSKNSSQIYKLRHKLICICRDTDYYFEDIKTSNKKTLVSKLLTRIYCDDLSLEDLEKEKEKLTSWQYFILKVAYFEKKNKKNGILFIKENKDEFEEKEQQKKIRMLLERLKNMKGLMLFDSSVYCNILNCSFDFELQKEILEKQQKASEEVIVPRVKKPEEPKTEKAEAPKKSVRNVEVKTVRHYVTNGTNVSFIQETPKTKKIIQKGKEKNILTVRSVYENEIEQIGKVLYLAMQDSERKFQAVEAWDRLEYLADSLASDVVMLERMENLLKRLGYLPKNKILKK